MRNPTNFLPLPDMKNHQELLVTELSARTGIFTNKNHWNNLRWDIDFVLKYDRFPGRYARMSSIST